MEKKIKRLQIKFQPKGVLSEEQKARKYAREKGKSQKKSCFPFRIPAPCVK